MTDTRTCPPCVGDCNQGRSCPANASDPVEVDQRIERRPVEGAGIVWAVVCGVPLFVALVALVAAVWPR